MDAASMLPSKKVAEKGYGEMLFLALVIAFAVAAVATVSSYYTFVYTDSAVRREAVKAGAAHWKADPQTGETSFVWNSCAH